jgi:polar amino acid transport system substrate-binding protein
MRMTSNLMKCAIILSVLLALLHPADATALPQETSPHPGSQKLVIGVVHDPPYLVKEKNGQWSGLNADIWKSVAEQLNVAYEFKEMPFYELIDALKTGGIDLSIESFFVMADRERFMDYSFAFGSTRLAVATLNEKMDHPWWLAIKLFFSWGTLKIVGLLCLCLCILGFVFWLIERKENPDHFGGGTMQGLSSGIYWVGSTLASGTCFGVALKSVTARVLGLIWMLLCAVALSALIASLSSSLSTARLTTEVINNDTLRHMHLGGVEGSAELGVLKKINGKYSVYAGEEDVLQAMLHGTVEGFLYDEITLHYYRDNNHKGRISVYPTNLRRSPFAFGLPKNSPWRSKINVALLDLMEKPDWEFLLSRYGLSTNFEERPSQMLGGKNRP